MKIAMIGDLHGNYIATQALEQALLIELEKKAEEYEYLLAESEVLQDELMQEIAADVTDAGRGTKTKALTYQAILEKKIR